MEVLCRNVPGPVNENNLKKELTAKLAEISIHTFHCRMLRAPGHAVITIADESKARALLKKYGQSQHQNKTAQQNRWHNNNHRNRNHMNDANNANSRQGNAQLPPQLYIFGTPIYLVRSHKTPDEHLLRILEDEERERIVRPSKAITSRTTTAKHKKTFGIVSFSCGTWDYKGNDPIFIEYFNTRQRGKVVFKKSAVVVSVGLPGGLEEHQVEFNFSDLSGPMYTGSHAIPSVTFTTAIAPRMFRTSLVAALEGMLMRSPGPNQPKKSTRRVTHLGGNHEYVAASCFTYRFILADPHDLHPVRLLSSDKRMPDMANWVDFVGQPKIPYYMQIARLLPLITDQNLPFRVKFQLQMLVWNGVLPPMKVAELIPHVYQLVDRLGRDRSVQVLSRLERTMRYAGPDEDKSTFDVTAIADLFSDLELDYRYQDSANSAKQSPHQISIHRAIVTPAGVYLYGPTLETKNRVLRLYSDFQDHFLRVEFLDETGDPVRYDPKANLDDIFQGRFKSVLIEGIKVAGRLYKFLGFSHSSLRYQTCWFVAGFRDQNGELIDAQTMIPKLGNFKDIRSPARCAARIGQTFSDTTTSIRVDEDVVDVIPDVERNGRCFSDGVGTLSKDVMYMIWREYAHRAKVKPTVFQIRFAGAKGMVSLDSTLDGAHLSLRRSMIKFQAPNSWNIELCGAGTNALPFFLNNQLIKILEDLGVPPQSFFALQAEDLHRLRSTTQSTQQAAQFLEQSNIAKSTRLPWLITILKGLGLSHNEDSFLRKIVELAVLVKLRDLKYRARIRVERAVTLYGIMDETGILREGEIFCPVLTERGFREILVRKGVVITRAPALHPGDIQIVDAVDVPYDSPLRQLHNCVVFSRHGQRDLPSKLSGGDLDGDLYNVIYDDRLTPKIIAGPADYPKQEERLLERQVTKQDIIEFFVLFMQQDQLGRIAMTHQTIADQKEQGTFDPDCLKLAELHSVAVDFSKTGNPVNLQEIPKPKPYRPDFMAPGPRVRIAEDISLLDAKMEGLLDEEDDDEENERAPMRYYKSNRVLGHLFRRIDERAFLEDLKASTRVQQPPADLLQSVWAYVSQETAGFQWDHHISAGLSIKDLYEDNLRDIMSQFSATPWKTSLTEYEVFIGNIMGHGQKQTKRQKEDSKSMKDEFDKLVEYTISVIIDKESGGVESLERSIACFSAAIHDWGDGKTKNTVLFYFAESPFFDATSNNASLTVQASYNETLRHFLETREAFEGRLKTMQGLEFIVAHDPLQYTAAEMAQKPDGAAPKEPSNVWVIRKQTRRKRSGMEEDEVSVLSTYFVVGDTLYMAPPVSSVIGSRMLSTVTSLTKVLSTASPLPIFSPSYGHTYMPPVAKSLDGGAQQQQQQSRQQSKENTPMPDVQQSFTSQGAASNFDNTSGNGGSTAQDTRNLAEAFNLFSKYGDEFMDDSPLVGEPGSFILSKQNEKPANAATARQKSGSGSGGTAGAAKLPPPPPPTASPAPGKPGPIKTDLKAAGKGTEKSPITPGGTKEKVKRKKSKAGVSATSPA
ncbi:hypothetical protein FQN54_008623 [Arachnomyces sp. PD_36]|nr:hypothetical protein FQN54_008623 [Arachnomyces sp. PD_36]